MNSSVRLTEWDHLSHEQRVDFRALKISEQQIEFGRSFRRSIRACMAGPHESIRGIGILLAHKPIGFVLLRRPPLSPEWAAEDMVTLHGLKIDVRWQGKGHGQAAFRGSMELARQFWPEAKHFALSVDCDNRAALSLYKRFGMKDSGPIFRGRMGTEHRLRTALR